MALARAYFNDFCLVVQFLMTSLAEIEAIEAQVLSSPFNGLSMTKYLEGAS